MKNADVLNCGCFFTLFILPSAFFLQAGGFFSSLLDRTTCELERSTDPQVCPAAAGRPE